MFAETLVVVRGLPNNSSSLRFWFILDNAKCNIRSFPCKRYRTLRMHHLIKVAYNVGIKCFSFHKSLLKLIKFYRTATSKKQISVHFFSSRNFQHYAYCWLNEILYAHALHVEIWSEQPELGQIRRKVCYQSNWFLEFDLNQVLTKIQFVSRATLTDTKSKSLRET